MTRPSLFTRCCWMIFCKEICTPSQAVVIFAVIAQPHGRSQVLISGVPRQRGMVHLQGQFYSGTAQQVCPGIPQGRTASEQHAKHERHFTGDDPCR